MNNNQLTTVTWQTLVKKGTVWSIWLFFLALLQTSFFSVITPFGAIPDMVLPAVITITVYDRERSGIISAISGGFIIDALGSVGLALSPLVYMLCSVVIHLLVHTVLRRDFVSWLLGTLASLIISSLFALISAYSSMANPAFSFSSNLTGFVIPRIFSSLLVALPIYFLTKLIWSRFFDNREMTG